jgi:lipopolysaccharide export system permease protein
MVASSANGRLLRRYVARRFMLTILGAFALLAILIFMIDLVELLRQAGKFGRVPSMAIAWMAILRLPAYSEFLLQFAVLVGSIGALLMLSRKSELAVMRAAGMSAWQFLRPGMWVAFFIGIVAVAVYNPLAAAARAESERLFAEAFGREPTVLRNEGAGAWLRQDGPDGPSVFNAAAVADQGRLLTSVIGFLLDGEGRFVERLDAAKATLKDRYWELENVWVTRVGQPAEHYASYVVSTALSPERVADALGTSFVVSIWQLPGLIDVAQKAGLPTARLRMQLEQLLARPFLLALMVILAATVSLRSFRAGGIQTMVVTGMFGGFGFFLVSEISRQVGMAGLAPPAVAVWVPIGVAACVAATVLLYSEDG